MKVYLIGAGPGDPGLFTIKGKEILSLADVIVYDYLANDILLSYARANAELIYAGKKGGDHTLTQEAINALIIAKAKEGKIVARLKGGDPYMFGRGAEEAEELLKAGIAFEEVPGITSAIAGPAYAGIPLTHRSHASSVCFATGHEDPTKPGSSHNWAALAKGGHTLVFFMGMKNLPDICKNLIREGLAENTPAALVHWGTTTRHRSLVGTLTTLPAMAKEQNFTSPSLIVIGSVVSLHSKLNWYEQLPLLGKTVVVTRAREQASESVALLASKGAEVIQFPTISITPLTDYSEADATINALHKYQWIIFTSVNSVRYFWARLEILGKDTRALAGIQVAAIGPATAKALVNQGVNPDFMPEKYVAEHVAKGLLQRGIKGKNVLLPRAKFAREVLPQTLSKAGAQVTVLPMYKNIPSAKGKQLVLDAIAAKTLDCITFGSSSTVENFLSLIPAEILDAHPHIKLACIGPITRNTLEKSGLTCDIYPDDFTIPALVNELVKKL